MTIEVQCWSTWDEKTTLSLVVENQVERTMKYQHGEISTSFKMMKSSNKKIKGCMRRFPRKLSYVVPRKWTILSLAKMFPFPGTYIDSEGYNIHALFIIYRIFFCWKGTATAEDSWQIASELLAEMKLLWPWEGRTDGQMEGLDMVRYLFYLLRCTLQKLNQYKSREKETCEKERIVFQSPFWIFSGFVVDWCKGSSGFTSMNAGGKW